MSGIVGFSGISGGDNRTILGDMSLRIRSPGASAPQAGIVGDAALAVAGLPGTVYFRELDDCRFALIGHPVWGDAQRSGLDTAGIDELIDSLRRDGGKALGHLQGDFALALVDAGARRVVLAVDRFAIRPLVYQPTASGLVFASSADALFRHPSTRRAVDSQALYNFLHFHMIPSPRTAFRDVLRLKAGCCLVAEGSGIRVEPYWQMRFAERRPFDTANGKTEFIASMEAGVKAYALPEAPTGTFLSGGTDSSTVTGLVERVSGRPPHTFSIGFEAEGYDEMAYARIAAAAFKTSHHEYYVTPANVVDTIPLVARAYDQPFGNASAIPTYHCARVAQEGGVTRMLAGDGGDELFGGNARYATQYLFSHYDRVPPSIRRGLLEPIAARTGFVDGIPPLRKLRSYILQAAPGLPARYDSYNLLLRLGPTGILAPEFLAGVDTDEPGRELGEEYSKALTGEWLNRLLAVDFKFTLSDNDLPKVTRMCELAGVDVAFPMLHQSVVDFSGELPAALKLKRTRLRYFFKEALRGFLPDEILAKEKHGFGLPVGPWLVSHPPLTAMAHECLLAFRSRGIVRPEFVSDLIDRRLREHPAYYGTMVWLLMMLELWFREHADR